MQDTLGNKAAAGDAEIELSHSEHRDVPTGYEDPHKAALEDNPEHAEKLSLSVILSALFLGTSFTGPIIFGFILVTPILVQLSQVLGGENIDFWIPSGWGAAAAVGFSIAGRLSDIFGRRYVILVGQLLTVVGAAAAASAHSMNQLIAGEVILGGSIGTVSVAYAGISEILPNKWRGVGLAWTELNLASWAIAGTLLANALLSHASWRVMFYIAAGYGVFSFIGTLFVYFPPSHPRPDGLTKWQEFKQLDFVGAALYVSGLAVFLFGLNSGGNTYPWKSAGTLAPLILGLIVFLGAFVYDFKVAKDPLFPWYLFKMFREFSSLLMLVFVAGMVFFFAASALNAQTILYLYTADPIKIGVYSIPSGAGQLVGGVIIPGLVHYIKYVHYQLTFSVFMQTLFFGLAALITPHNINWVMAVQFLAMLPFGWITLNWLHDCVSACSPERPWRCYRLDWHFPLSRWCSKQVPHRIADVALNAGISAKILPDLIEAVSLTLVGVPGQAATVPSVSASVFSKCVDAARLGYAYGFRITWLASIPFGVIAMCCAVAVRDPSKYFTNHVEVHLEKEIGGNKHIKDGETKQA
ncbi:hypothetical protein LTS15_004025 [Exophiala xenobiotica]|nr:hypothetical protein LTS15_004025 [Exophiala xenobiotica]